MVGVEGFQLVDSQDVAGVQVADLLASRIAKEQDGACYGDSGGPGLLRFGEKVYLVGVTSSGDMPCLATNTATRTDTSEANILLTDVLAKNPDGDN